MMWFKTIIYVIIVTTIISVISGGYLYLNNLNENIKQLSYENSLYKTNFDKMKSVVDQNENTIKDMEARSEEIRKIYENVQSDISLYRMYGNEIPSTLQRHDLNTLAYSKPELVEKLINEGSKNSLRCAEILSGSKLTEKEKGELNVLYKTCPWIQ